MQTLLSTVLPHFVAEARKKSTEELLKQYLQSMKMCQTLGMECSWTVNDTHTEMMTKFREVASWVSGAKHCAGFDLKRRTEA